MWNFRYSTFYRNLFHSHFWSNGHLTLSPTTNKAKSTPSERESMQSGKRKLYRDFSLINGETCPLHSEWVGGRIGWYTCGCGGAKWICTGTWLRFLPSQAQLKQQQEQQCSWTLVPSFQTPPLHLNHSLRIRHFCEIYRLSFLAKLCIIPLLGGWLGCWMAGIQYIIYISLALLFLGWLPVFEYYYGKGRSQIRAEMMKATFFKSNFLSLSFCREIEN